MQKIPMPSQETIAEALEDFPADLRQRFSEGPPMLNVFRELMHSPPVAIGLIRLGTTMFCESALSPVDRELAILVCGKCYSAPYETAQHKPISKAVGVSKAQRHAIKEGDWTADCFTHKQKVLLKFMAEVATHPKVPGHLLSEMKKCFGERETIEAVVIAGIYFLVARVTTVFEVPVDAPKDDSILKAAIAIHDVMAKSS